MFYQIYVEKRKNTYTYESKIELKSGTFCEVDFANKKLLGIVIRESKKEEIGDFKIKKIDKVLLNKPIISENLLSLVRFINSYYITDFFASMKLLGPYESMDVDRMNSLEVLDTYKGNYVILNEDQEKIYKDILKSNEKFFLIKGITGSGKTQIYLKLMEKALKENKSSLFLVPEISLTNQIMKDIKKIFGDNISIIHSKMTKAKKVKEWEKLYSGKCKIVIGARSALFSPVKDLEYIILDEEHENTYKQEDNARYHTRNVAIKRAMLENCKLILGSATPSFESYYLANENKIKLLTLDKRYNNAQLPDVELVNLEDEEGLLSKKLLLSIKETISKGEQVILMLNRKSYSLLVKCNECGEKVKCPRCSTNLHYFKNSDLMVCNHCDYKSKKINECPYCSSKKLEFLGVGVEKIEEELIEKFGEEIILRMDGTKTEKQIRDAYESFSNGDYKILVGTQILAKGFHFPNVTLVGIINSEQVSQFNDFRTNEKSFQLITQAMGRAGRGEKRGRVIIQSYDVNSSLINHIVNGNYVSFFNEEIFMRKTLNLPPFSRIVKIIVSDKNEERCLKKINYIYKEISKYFKKVSFPTNASVYKINNHYRNLIYIKTNNEEIKKFKIKLLEIKNMSNNTTRILVDVDPISIN